MKGHCTRCKQNTLQARSFGPSSLMMMIAFITMNSGLVPLIENLCAQIYGLRFEIISGWRSHLFLFFFGKKSILNEKTVSPRSHPAS